MLLHRTVVLTTSFSGAGTAETALAMLAGEARRSCEAGAAAQAPPSAASAGFEDGGVHEAAQEEELNQITFSSNSEEEDDKLEQDRNTVAGRAVGKTVMYSATDISPLCPKCLLAHPCDSQPQHVFGDVLGRLPAEVKKRCLHIEADKLLAYEQARAAAVAQLTAAGNAWDEDDSSAEPQEPPGMMEYKVKLGNEMVWAMVAELQACTFEETDWCHRHHKFCFVDPKSDPAFADAFTLEVAGPCCPPWSTMNPRRDRWLSTSTLPALAWVYSTRYRRPAAIIHENAPGWDDSAAVKAFSEVGVKRALRPLSSEDLDIDSSEAIVWKPTQQPKGAPLLLRGRASAKLRKKRISYFVAPWLAWLLISSVSVCRMQCKGIRKGCRVAVAGTVVAIGFWCLALRCCVSSPQLRNCATFAPPCLALLLLG